MSVYERPKRLDAALSLLCEPGWTVIAGGTDHFPARVRHEASERILDITAIPELGGVETGRSGLRIGAAATWSEIVESELPRACDGLKAAAREVGGLQIQNRGTLGGNLCNASPAADGIPTLLSLAADVELSSSAGSRRMPLEAFVLGNRRTACRPDELLTAVHIPANVLDGPGVFLKLGARRYLVISIVMVAGTLGLAEDGTIRSARLAVGACSAAATRLPALEADMVGARPSEAQALVAERHLAALTPIDDPRADAAYRLDAAGTLTRRCLRQLAEAA